MGDLNNAENFWTQAVEHTAQMKTKGRCERFGEPGNHHGIQGETDKAIECYQVALEMSQEIGFEDGISANLSNLGMIFLNQGDYPKALELYQQALKID